MRSRLAVHWASGDGGIPRPWGPSTGPHGPHGPHDPHYSRPRIRQVYRSHLDAPSQPAARSHTPPSGPPQPSGPSQPSQPSQHRPQYQDPAQAPAQHPYPHPARTTGKAEVRTSRSVQMRGQGQGRRRWGRAGAEEGGEHSALSTGSPSTPSKAGALEDDTDSEVACPSTRCSPDFCITQCASCAAEQREPDQRRPQRPRSTDCQDRSTLAG